MNELPKIRFCDVKNMGSVPATELLDAGPHIVTADSVEKFVIMNFDNYYALLPVNPNPPRQPKMVRIAGVLYREVI